MGKFTQGLVALCALLSFTVLSSEAQATSPEGPADEVPPVEEQAPPATDEAGSIIHRSALGIRATPIGLNLFSDTGWRQPLWDRPDSDIMSNTRLEAGLTTTLSPVFAWGGPFVEFTPVAVLRLRASAQFMSFFGNLGYLHVPADGEDWSLSALEATADENLGQSATGWMVHTLAQPQIRVGRIVAMAETNLYFINVDLDSNYYEPFFDMFFAPQERMFITRPTVGYLLGRDLADSFLLLALRWEHTRTFETDLSRDIVGLVFNWKVPSRIMDWGEPAVAGFTGVFLNHPNRPISPYGGVQLMVNF